MDTNDFNFVVKFDYTLFDTTSGNSTTTLDGEDVFDRHEEWFVKIVFWDIKVFIHSVDEIHDTIFHFGVAFKSFKSRTLDDWSVVTIEAVFVKKFTDIHLNELNEFWISKVHLVEEDDDFWNVHLVSKKNVLTSLWKWTIVSSNYEDSTINLSSTGNHVLDVVGVAWHINVSVVTLFRFVLLVRSSNGNTTCFFFWSVIDLIISDRFVYI